jgi:hypothetical protein
MILDDASCPHHLQLCFISLLLPWFPLSPGHAQWNWEDQDY